MLPTAALQRCPYILQVMAALQTVVGRSRLMRLSAGADVPSHSDGNYTWRKRVRIHVPIVTHPDVTFSSIGNLDVHMAAGETWTFDNWRQHAVYNRSNVARIHLVIDTVGTSRFWEIVRSGWDPSTQDNGWSDSVRYQPFVPDADIPNLDFERFNAVPVRSPDEIDNMLDELVGDLDSFKGFAPRAYEQMVDEIERFKQDWRSYWALYWDSADAIPHYELLAKRLRTRLRSLLENVTFDSNEANAYEVAAGWIASTTDSTLNQSDGSDSVAAVATSQGSSGRAGIAVSASALSLEEYIQEFKAPIFKQPVFIVAAPRSGSTMLFEALQKNKELWTIGDESHREVESISSLHPENRGFDSNALVADDYTPQIGAQLMEAFMNRLQNAAGGSYFRTPEELRPSSLRFLEKTPKNALRILFFRQMFPDAKFIFLHRAAGPNIGSIIDVWESQKFVTYPRLPGWDGPKWSLLLPEGWRGMQGRTISEIAAWQWAQTNESIVRDLSTLPRADWIHVSYESLLDNTSDTLQRLCRFANIPFGPRMQALASRDFPISRYTLTEPDADKWKRHEKEISAARSLYLAVEQKISDLDQSESTH